MTLWDRDADGVGGGNCMGSEHCSLGDGDCGGLTLATWTECVLYGTIAYLFLHVVDDDRRGRKRKLAPSGDSRGVRLPAQPRAAAHLDQLDSAPSAMAIAVSKLAVSSEFEKTIRGKLGARSEELFLQVCDRDGTYWGPRPR